MVTSSSQVVTTNVLGNDHRPTKEDIEGKDLTAEYGYTYPSWWALARAEHLRRQRELLRAARPPQQQRDDEVEQRYLGRKDN